MGHDRSVSPPLVLLAAGLGTRFGGAKQLAPVGPGGEPLFALTARQALAEGFGRVLVVTRAALAHDVEALISAHLGGGPVEVVLQDGSGPSRDRPWGTAHAVSVCAPLVDGPIGVGNADDYYGGAAIRALAGAVAGLGPDDAVVVGYRLGDTLSSNGPVNRALCRVDGSGRVIGMEECCGLRRRGDVAIDAGGNAHPLDAPVSMNLLGLGSGVPGRLARRFAAFSPEHAGDLVEMVLPDELASLVEEGTLSVRYLAGGDRWAGLTRRGDLDDLRRVVAGDVAPPPVPG